MVPLETGFDVGAAFATAIAGVLPVMGVIITAGLGLWALLFSVAKGKKAAKVASA